MAWFCLLLVVLLVAGTIIVVLFSRINSLENRIQTQEGRTFALENLPPGISSLPEIPEELKPPVLETGEPVVNKPLHYPTDPAPPATEPAAGTVGTPIHLPQLPQLPEQTPEPQPVKIELPILDSPPVVKPEPEPVPAVETQPQEIPKVDELKTADSLEIKLGKVWFVRVGVVMVLTGLVYLAQMGYKGIDEAVRPYVNASLLYLVSFGLMMAGLFLHKRFEFLKNFSEVLTGGGMAAVYFSTFALYRVEAPILGLIKTPMYAGVLLAAWAIFIIWFATKKRSEVMAMFAVAGAYYASYVPLIYDTTGSQVWFTFASNIALAIAATFFVIRNRWANLSFLALLTTYVGFAYWRFKHPVGDTATFQEGAIFLGVYWIIFTAAGFLSRHEQMTANKRSTFINLNNGGFFALITITMLQVPELRDQYWIFPLAFSGVLVGLYFLAKRLLTDEELFADVILAKAAVLLTLAFMTLQSAGQFRALLLAAESITILYFGLRTHQRLLQYAAAAIALVGAAFAGYEVVLTVSELHGGFRAPTLRLGIFFGILMLIGAWVARHWEGERTPDDPLRQLPDFFATIGLSFGLITCLSTLTREHPAITAFALSSFGLIALCFNKSLRTGAVLIFGEIYLLGGLLLWLPLGFSQNSIIPEWNPILMLLTFALAQQWHQRYADEKTNTIDNNFFIHTVGQAVCTIGIGLISIGWTLHLLDFDLTHMAVASAIMGLLFTAYAYGLRSGQVYALAQFFVVSAPVLYVLQMVLPKFDLTWQFALVPLLITFGNGLFLERAKEHLANRFDLSPSRFSIDSSVLQAVSILAGLMVALKFVPEDHQLWVLPMIGVLLSIICLGLSLTPAIIASQSFIIIAALIAPLRMFVPEAEAFMTLIPVLVMLGMSHFLLHSRELFEDKTHPLRVLGNVGIQIYFFYGWALCLVWGIKFVPDEASFLIFTVVAIGHALAHRRRERLERIIVAAGFFLVGFLSFWVHTAMHWNAPRFLDVVPLLLLLGVQLAMRRRDKEGEVAEIAHTAVIIIINISLWQWTSRMVPGDADVISWGVLAFVLIGLGLFAMERAHRLFGLFVLLVSIANLTLLAWQTLKGAERILTFMGMGVILIVLGGLYHKYQEKMKEYL